MGRLQDTPTQDFRLRITFMADVGLPEVIDPIKGPVSLGFMQSFIEIQNRTSGEIAKFSLGALSLGVGPFSTSIGSYSSPWKTFRTDDPATLADFEGHARVAGITINDMSPFTVLALPVDLDHGSVLSNVFWGDSIDISGITDSMGWSLSWSAGFMDIYSWRQELPDDGWLLDLLREHSDGEFGYSPKERIDALNEVRKTLREADDALIEAIGGEKFEVEFEASMLPDDIDLTDPNQLDQYNQKMFADPALDPTGMTELRQQSERQAELDEIEQTQRDMEAKREEAVHKELSERDIETSRDAIAASALGGFLSQGAAREAMELADSKPQPDNDEPISSILDPDDHAEGEQTNSSADTDELTSCELDPEDDPGEDELEEENAGADPDEPPDNELDPDQEIEPDFGPQEEEVDNDDGDGGDVVDG